MFLLRKLLGLFVYSSGVVLFEESLLKLPKLVTYSIKKYHVSSMWIKQSVERILFNAEPC